MCSQVSLQDTGQGGAGVGGQAGNGGTSSPAVAPACPWSTHRPVHRNFSGLSWSTHWTGAFVGAWGQPSTCFCRPQLFWNVPVAEKASFR